MKKLYTAPEAEILCFRPMEELAGNVFMDDLLKGENKITPGKVNGDAGSDTDIFIELF